MEAGPESSPQPSSESRPQQSESGGAGYSAEPTDHPGGPRPVPDGFGSDGTTGWTEPFMGGAVGVQATGVGVQATGDGAMAGEAGAMEGGAPASAIRPWWADPSGEESADQPRPPGTGFTASTQTLEGDTLFPVRRRGHTRRTSRVGRRGRSGRRGRLAAAVTLAAVVALVVGLVELDGGSGTALPATSGGIVLTSARTTLATKTADFHMTIGIQTAGDQITATGDGAVDFANNTSQATFTYAGASQLDGVQLQEVFAGGNVFLSMPEISQLVPGKSWISAPVAASNSISPGSTNPTAIFKMLTSEGSNVTPLGPSTIGGEAVQGYHVAISSADLMEGVDRADLPPSAGQEVKSLFGNAGVQMSVYVGDDTHLLRRVTFSMHVSVASTSVSAQATEDISNYGAPVSISAPPSDQVVSLQQFDQAALSDPGAAGQPATVSGTA